MFIFERESKFSTLFSELNLISKRKVLLIWVCEVVHNICCIYWENILREYIERMAEMHQESPASSGDAQSVARQATGFREHRKRSAVDLKTCMPVLRTF